MKPLLIIFFISLNSYANQIPVYCFSEGPNLEISAYAKGTLTPKTMPETNSHLVEGTLNIVVINNQKSKVLFENSIQVIGQYRVFKDHQFATLASTSHPEINSIHVNYSEKNLSFLDYKGKRSFMDCTAKQN